MPKSAYVFLDTMGTVVRVHSPDVSTSFTPLGVLPPGVPPPVVPGGPNLPSNEKSDLEVLLAQGYRAMREHRTESSANWLLVLEKP